tara:strand:- start:1089 stop:1391 length:303 start_codon:yes stop_codon:yes gene_type:complete
MKRSNARTNFASKVAAIASEKQKAHNKVVEHGRLEREKKKSAALLAEEKKYLQQRQKFVIMTYKELRTEAKNKNIPEYWKKSKEALIDKLTKLTITKSNK